MRFTQNIAAASALLTLASASPIVDRRQKANKDFVVKQSVAKPSIKSGPAALAGAYAKYGKPVPQDVAAAAAGNDGTVTTNPTQYDSEYLTPVTIGGQQLTLDFDTGSSDLWVFSSETPANEVNSHTIYDPSKSSSSNQLQGYTWSITYGDKSSSSGDVYTDTVSVGQTTFANQAVELAQQVSTQFQQDVGNDGLLGLGFSSINTVKPQQQMTFFDNVKSSLSSPLFTADLQKGKPGTYSFGSIDESAHTGAITYVPVDSSRGFWGFTADSYSVDGGSSGGAISNAIADTGTSLLLLDDTVVTAYYSGVPGAQNDQTQGGYTYPCNTTLPAITFTIGGYAATVPGSYVNYAPTDASGTTCFGGIQSNTGIGVNIFGDIFLKSQFVIFNGDTSPQLGFAAKPLV